MLLDAANAKALATVIVLSTFGADALKKEQPLQVEDRGALWLVTGTMYRDESIGAQHIVTHVFLDKASAEVKGFGKSERMILSEAEQQVLLQAVTPEQLARVLGPPTFEPGEIADIYRVLYGGVINTPADAIAYAHILLAVPQNELQANLRDGIWHIGREQSGRSRVDVLQFSRATAGPVSGGSEDRKPLTSGGGDNAP